MAAQQISITLRQEVTAVFYIGRDQRHAKCTC